MVNTRRQVILSATAALAGVSMPYIARAQTQKVRVAWLPLAGGSAAIVMEMIRNKLFERAAKDLGEQIEVEWRSFASGPAATEAVVTGQVDIDLHASSLVIVNRIASGVRSTPFAVVGSHISNALLVRPNSEIRSVSQLKGKRVGLPIGTSAHYLLASIVKTHFGKSLNDASIRLVNMPAADAMKMPSGIDVASVWIPLRFIGPKIGVAKMLVDGDGRLGEATDSPGKLADEVRRSWAFPEGYNTDRLYASAQDDFIAKNPNRVVAFLRAHMEAERQCHQAQDELVTFVAGKWNQDPDIVRLTLQYYAETSGVRNAPYILEWDVLTIAKASEFLYSIGARDKPLTMAQLIPLLSKAAHLQQSAWQAETPHIDPANWESGFKGKTPYGSFQVNGGQPIWLANSTAKWGTRIYRAGPF